MKDIEIKRESQTSITERISYLDSLRAFAIIMVVGVHSLGSGVRFPPDQGQIVTFMVHAISVPVFFLVDGYLFARSVIFTKNYSYLKYVRNSLVRLLVPWVVFTVAYTLARYVFELTGFLKDRMIIGHPWPQVLTSAYGSVYAPQMYFLLSLFLIRLSSPALKKIFIRKNYFVMLSLFVCYYAAYRSIIPLISPHLNIAGGQEPVLHALWGLQFYLVGMVLFRTSELLDLKKL